MATKDSIMKQSIFFWVFGHRLSFEYGLKKFLFGAWRNLSGALRELILNSCNILICIDVTVDCLSKQNIYCEAMCGTTENLIDKVIP